MTSRQELILFLISRDPGVRDIYRLIKLFDRADFPANMTENLKVLLDNNLIQPTKYFGTTSEPSEFSITQIGKSYLDKNFNENKIMDYIQSMQTPGILLDITKAYIDKRKTFPKQPIIWTGDLDDDCTAIWNGLMLRAEWMDEDYWWWCVYDMEKNDIQIDSSNNYSASFLGGEVSRKKAEEVAKKYRGISDS